MTVDLTPAVYCVIQWQQATLPRFISFEDVRRLADRITYQSPKMWVTPWLAISARIVPAASHGGFSFG